MCDEELILRARNGDKAAESELLNKYSPLAKAVSAGFFLIGGTDEDLFQEAMVGLYSAVNGFSSANGANFTTYAYKCMRNAVLDAVKKNTGNKNKALNSSVPIVEIAGEFSPSDPEDELIRREQRREFLQKISKILSSFEFKATVMYLDGLTASEIAAALDKNTKSVDNALTRAKTKLHKSYYTEE